MSNDYKYYTALLKNAKYIPVLNTGISKTVNTPLTSTFSARYIKVPTNPKYPHYADRHILASIKKIVLTLSFSRGHRNGNVPRIEWDQC